MSDPITKLEGCEEIYSFLREILHDNPELSKELLEGTTPRISILQALQERHIIFKWSKDPSELIQIFEHTLQREDLATKIQEWSGNSCHPMACS